MKTNRRDFIRKSAIAAVGMGVVTSCDTSSKEKTTTEKKKTRCNPIGVSTYSFWQFNGPKENAPIEDCIEKAAEMGFDGIEFLLVQMQSEENSYLQKLKRQAFHAGLDLMGFSTHQGFVYPEKEKRQAEVEKTIHQIELAYQLVFPPCG